MALEKPAPPPEVPTAVREGLLVLLDGPSHGGAGQILHKRSLGGPSTLPSQADVGLLGATPVDHNPQQVFVLGLEDLAIHPGAADPRPGGWRLFAGNTQGKIVLCRVVHHGHHPGWKLTACLWGDRVWDAFQDSLSLDNLPAVRTADYELRLLAVPGLNLEAFWLVALGPGLSDLIVPFSPLPGQPFPISKTPATIDKANFLSIIGPWVKRRMSSPRSEVS